MKLIEEKTIKYQCEFCDRIYTKEYAAIKHEYLHNVEHVVFGFEEYLVKLTDQEDAKSFAEKVLDLYFEDDEVLSVTKEGWYYFNNGKILPVTKIHPEYEDLLEQKERVQERLSEFERIIEENRTKYKCID